MFKNIRLNLFIYLNISLWLALVPLAVLFDIESIKAQITPANPNDTNTRIDSNIDNDETFTTIDGGTQSGVNLFHSFDEFNVNQNQTVNFTVNEGIGNIINRVTGGNVSEINGSINSPVNFYLMNPAGIIFGNGASLDNINGNFTATTANGIGFGSDWFSASGINNYTALTGNPTAFGFTMEQPGGIDIRGNLGRLLSNEIGAFGNLSFVAGTVVSSGEVSSDRINITTVPGNSLVTLTEPGNPLSLEIQPISASSTQPNNWNLSILSLPELLTAGNSTNANRFTDNGDGSITLSGSGIRVENGDVALENITQSAYGGLVGNVIDAAEVNILANRNLLVEGNIIDNNSNVQSRINILANDNLLIEGDIETDGSDITLSANEGNISILDIEGGEGGFSGDVNITAGKDITIENLQASDSDIALLNAGGDITIQEIVDGSGGPNSGGNASLNAGESITVQNIDMINGDISLTAVEDINIGEINSSEGGDISLNAEGNIITGNIDTSTSFGDAGSVDLNAGENITFNSINTQAEFGFENNNSGGNVNLTAGGIIQGTGTIPIGENNIPNNTTIFTRGNTPGSINISHKGGFDNIPFKVGDASENGTAGDIRSGNSVIQSEAFYGGPVEFPVLENGGDVTTTPDGTPLDGITITSVNSPPTVTANQQINLSKTEATTLTFEELNAIVDDADGDNTSIQIDEVTSGTLTVNRNGVEVEVTPGTTINPGDTLEYTPPRTVGDINAFVVSASDGVSSSTAQTVGGTITNTPPTLESNPNIVTTGNQPAEFTFEDLKAVVTDADGDAAFVQLDEIRTGTLRRNNGNNSQVLTPGTTLSPGDTFTYTPPENASGNIPAFTISASDGFESSAPNSVGVTAVASQAIQPPEGETGNQGKIEVPFEPPKFPVNQLPPVSIDPVVFNVDNKFAFDYESYFNFAKRERVSLVQAREILLKIEKAAGIKPAIIYADFNPITLDVASSQNKQILKTNRLELILVTADGAPIRKTIQTANQEQILAEVKEFYKRVLQPSNNKYKEHSQNLYNWIIAPLEQELETKGINNLLFITSEKLRSVPLAALHDGEKYLVQKYSVGFAPSLSLTDTTYKDIRNSQVLAMGTSEFQDDDPLPAVPQEVTTIAQNIWKGKHYLNEDFTFNKLKSIRKTQPFGIIHLATHGYFTKGSPDNHFMRFWNRDLKFTDFRELDLNNPSPVELLVFSACQTALGDNDAELGFGGLAARTGAKTAVASLWRVSDLATLGLMAEFYEQLKKVPVKSEALRKAQTAMITGQIRVEDGYLVTPSRKILLPQNYKSVENQTLQHPHFWSPFTMIGNPW